MAYIAVSEQLVNKYCGREHICFWVSMALITPHEGHDAFMFDCTMYRYVKSEFKETPEARVLLSFKSPVSPTGIAFAGNMGFELLQGDARCDLEVVLDYISRALKYVEERIEEVGRELRRVHDRVESARKLIPIPLRDTAVLKGVYYGLQVKYSILKDIASKMGYDGTLLKAMVKPVYVLVSLNLSKRRFSSLVMNKRVELKAHDRIVDVEALVNTLSSTKIT